MTKKTKQLLLMSLGVSFTVVFFQNCAPYHAIQTGAASSLASGEGSEPLPVSTPVPTIEIPDGVDVGSTDRSLFFGQSRCADSRYDFCEDFESGILNPAWQLVGSPVVDSAQAARGLKALHITKTGSGSSGLRLRSIFPATGNTFYGRMFIRFHSLPKAPLSYLHWNMVGAAGTGTNAEIRVGGQWQSQKNRLHIGTDGGPTGDWGRNDKNPGGGFREPPLDEWMCYEWLFKGDTHDTKFWWDGTEHEAMATSLNSHGGNQVPFELPFFNRVFVGWQSYQSSDQTYELFIDEIAFHHERIGCAR
ncbi:MAG: hypothetical protein EOP05_05860 [Proteobacteria bacterium]|nr:MAG: hypothetical protein EOP05_05860 [Pseudomonadota bacterium]